MINMQYSNIAHTSYNRQYSNIAHTSYNRHHILCNKKHYKTSKAAYPGMLWGYIGSSDMPE